MQIFCNFSLIAHIKVESSFSLYIFRQTILLNHQRYFYFCDSCDFYVRDICRDVYDVQDGLACLNCSIKPLNLKKCFCTLILYYVCKTKVSICYVINQVPYFFSSSLDMCSLGRFLLSRIRLFHSGDYLSKVDSFFSVLSIQQTFTEHLPCSVTLENTKVNMALKLVWYGK